MRLSVSIPTALALVSLPILLAAPVPHGPGSASFTKTGTLVQRDGGNDIASAVQHTIDTTNNMSESSGASAGDNTGEADTEPARDDSNIATIGNSDGDNTVGENPDEYDPETSAQVGVGKSQSPTMDTRSIGVATGTGTGTGAGTNTIKMIPRVVDSRQRRMKRAPMHLAWMAPRSDVWHTKRSHTEGVGKVMTNAERLANGLTLLPPTKRSTAPHRRASTQTTLNTRQNVVVHVIASDGTDLGALTPSDGSNNGNTDGLITFDPNTRTPIQFQLPDGSGPSPGGNPGGGPGAGGSFGPVGPQTGGNGRPFEIRPSNGGGLDNLFGGLGRQLLGAIPHVLGEGELKPGSPNFANVGMGQCDQGNPLNLNLPPLPLIDQVGGLLSGLPQLLGKVPGLLGINLGGGSGGGEGGSGGPLGGLGGIGGLGDLTKGGLGSLLHIVGPGAGSGSASGTRSEGGSPVPATDVLPNGSGGGGSPLGGGDDGGLLGLHLPSQLLGLSRPPSPPGSGSNKAPTSEGTGPITSGNENGAHSHEEPVNPSTGQPGGFPLESFDSDKLSQPVEQPAQSAIWHCDERGNMGASWTNPDGSKIPAQFFTGGPCAHTICLAADVQALKAVHGDELAEVHLVAGLL